MSLCNQTLHARKICAINYDFFVIEIFLNIEKCNLGKRTDVKINAISDHISYMRNQKNTSEKNSTIDSIQIPYRVNVLNEK